MIPNEVADRAQLLLMGINLQPYFQVNPGYLKSIVISDVQVNNPVRGLSYTPSPIAIIPQTYDVQISFTYMFNREDTLFDFAALPYTATNIQLMLQSAGGKVLLLAGGVYYRQAIVNYPKIGTAALRTVNLGAFTANYS